MVVRMLQFVSFNEGNYKEKATSNYLLSKPPPDSMTVVFRVEKIRIVKRKKGDTMKNVGNSLNHLKQVADRIMLLGATNDF